MPTLQLFAAYSLSDCIVSLFSQTAMKQRLPGRITDLLGVAVSPKDSLSEQTALEVVSYHHQKTSNY